MSRSRHLVLVILLTLVVLPFPGCYPGEAEGRGVSLAMSLSALEVNAADVRGWLDWLDDGQPGDQRDAFELGVNGNFFLSLGIVDNAATVAVPLGGGNVSYLPDTGDLVMDLEIEVCTDCSIDATIFWIRMDQGTKTYTGTSTPFSVAGGMLTSARQPEINAAIAETGTIRCQVPATAGVGTNVTLAALDQAERVRFTPGSGTVSANGLQLDLAEIPIRRPFMVQRQNADGVSFADVESVTLGKSGEVRVVGVP